MASKFEDLEFGPRFADMGPEWGVSARSFYPNGYGVSVIRGKGTYGSESGLYELAVFAGTPDKHHLCYDTPVTSDVEGNLTPDAVTALMQQVAALPARVAQSA